ncbi:hypothetical protein M1M11_02590 [Pseudomonas azerbaijanoccidens]|uniref:hypothetical protein n=1 Tax=Pseudomonas azerbaijanoccidentalis TaxID=2842347 RepID=UPI00200AFAD0|nr:hypothetical protein [Pseudomonas azerbaijanoccidentalis]MCK8663766.1 hypothetical protein [Pseudomonas azerbaijanoccidentalis]
MTLIKRIHCVTDREPTKYHDTVSYSVNLNLECEDEEDSAPAKDAFTHFLDAIPTAQFHVYEISKTVSGYEARHVGELSPAGPMPSPGSEHLMTWLEEHEKKANGTFWTHPTQTAELLDKMDAVGESQICATHLLRGSHSWSAPVAHSFGLTRLLRITLQDVWFDPTNQILVALPHLSGNIPASPLRARDVGDGRWDIDYLFDPRVGDVVCRANPMVATEDTLPRFLTDEGYLVVNADAANVRRVIDWFERGWAGLVSGLPAILSIDAEVFQPVWHVEQAPDKPASATLEAGAAAWRLVAGLVTALDPILVALLRPQAASQGGSGAAGDVLLSLVNDILDAAQPVPLTKLKLTAADVTQAIRTVLRESPILKAGTSMDEFIDQLLAVHGIANTADSGEPAVRLFHLLLDSLRPSFQLPKVLSWSEVQQYAKEADITKRRAVGFGADPYHLVMDAVQNLHEEAGAEEAMLRIFSSAARGVAITDLLWGQLQQHAAPPSGGAIDEDIEGFRKRLYEAWNSFTGRLKGPFNGEEAARRSASADYLEALLADARAIFENSPSATDLEKSARDADLFHARLLGAGAGGCFQHIVAHLPKILNVWGVALPKDLSDLLTQVYADMLRPLQEWVSAGQTFTLDDAPAPLPIQVSALLGSAELDAFSNDFNGICVALRRIDDTVHLDSNRWAHAHLASLRMKHAGEITGLFQWLPAAQDQRVPMFIDYKGYPFASRTIARVGGAATTVNPFYDADEADIDRTPWAPVPKLIYGRAFEALSFATTNSGSVPRALQNATSPWLPNAVVTAPGSIFTAISQRRTAIGAVDIREVKRPDESGKIGAGIPDVTPLSDDYPCIGLAASPGFAASLDLLREPDGSGMLAFPHANSGQDALHLDLADFTWTGAAASVHLEFFDKEAVLMGATTASIVFSAFDPKDLAQHPGMTISLYTQGGVFRARLGSQEKTVAAPRAALWWIRLRIDSTSPVSIAFADPRARGRPEGKGAPLLLMAPSTGDWIDGIPKEVKASIVAPRVSYLDFERWYENPDLLVRTFRTMRDKGERLLDALLVAYVRRDEPLLEGGGTNIANLLDRLPDPAVEALQVELVCTDAFKPQYEVPLPIAIDLREKVENWAAPLDKDTEHITLAYLREQVFSHLEEQFAIPLVITSTGLKLSLEKKNGTVYANIPEGVVAELRVTPVVPAAYFNADAHGHPSVIHAGVAQTARPHDAGRSFIFSGAKLRIETMYDGMKTVRAVSLVESVVSCKPKPLVREYAVISKGNITDASDRAAWRLIGEVAVSTQRWQPGGRPIYKVIDPRAHALGVVSAPAVPLKSAKPLLEFESEIFLGRKEEDAETIWKTLDPQVAGSGHPPAQAAAKAACTVLQSVSWNAPSATYMRHRFQLRSRYSGALKSQDSKAAAAWPINVEHKGSWTHRVALLADRTRVAVSRPQLRALIPLTTSVQVEDTPPILGYLQEPPFSEGGLADRISAEIKLGFGFGFASASGTLGILDARKEFGPDPRLDFRRISRDDALSIVLNIEGPVGLTFDSPQIGAPAFANSVVSMSPTLLGGGSIGRTFEEHFLGVSLRRYLDPAWLVDAVAKVQPVPGAQCHWIDIAPLPWTSQQVLVAYGNNSPLILFGGSRFLQGPTEEIDKGGSNAGQQWVDIAKLPEGHSARLAVLHSPVAPGRYSASIFAILSHRNISRGETEQPVLLASFEWSPRVTGSDEAPSEVALVAPGGKIFPCVSSAPTFLAWTRTSRDFSRIAVMGEQPENSVDVGMLVARRPKNGEPLDFMIERAGKWEVVVPCPSTFQSQFPIHVHRHLAVIGTRVAEGMGKPLSVFSGSAMAGPLAATVPDVGDLANATQVRIIEYESPASILCAALERNAQGELVSGRNIPAPYSTAYFDLRATGGSWSRLVKLFIRFIGSNEHLKKFGSLTLRLEQPEGAQKSTPLDVTVALPADIPAAGLELVIRKGANQGESTVKVLIVSRNGTRTLTGLVGAPFKHGDDLGFLLSMAASESAEFWTDISMLHFVDGHQKDGEEDMVTSFDFDLLFSEASRLKPADAVQAQALARMVEAQARIVAVSPPIRVEQ